MFARVFGRQIAALVLALGVFLGGVGPSWAAPVSSIMSDTTMTMSDMPMNCAEMEKSLPDKPMPCNGSDSCCAVCTTCVVNVGARFSLHTLFYRGAVRAISRSTGHNSLAWPPPLPPPIHQA
jgi:hypothetical protein